MTSVRILKKRGVKVMNRFRLTVVTIFAMASCVYAEVTPRTAQIGTEIKFTITNPAISPQSAIQLSCATNPLPGDKVSLRDGTASFEMTFTDAAPLGECRILLKNGKATTDAGYFVTLDKKGEKIAISNVRSGPAKLEKNKLTLPIQVDFDCPAGVRFSNLVAVRIPKTDKKVSAFTADLASYNGKTSGTLNIVAVIDKFKPGKDRSVPFEIMVDDGTQGAPGNPFPGMTPPASGSFTLP